MLTLVRVVIDCVGGLGFRGVINEVIRDGVHHADQRVPQHLVTEFVALPHHIADHRLRALRTITLVLHGLVQHRVEVITLGAERRQPKSGQRAEQFVGDQLQRPGFQVSVTACAVEIVEHAQ